jgi:hypothetical protein
MVVFERYEVELLLSRRGALSRRGCCHNFEDVDSGSAYLLSKNKRQMEKSSGMYYILSSSSFCFFSPSFVIYVVDIERL